MRILSPWLDLRLSELLHEQNLFFVSAELELGFWCKQTAHYEGFVGFCFELSSLTIVHPSHDISDVLLSGHVHGRWQQRFVRLSMTWFEIVGTASWTKPFFVSAELELGFWCNTNSSLWGFSLHDLIWDCRHRFYEQNLFSFLLNWS